MSASPVTAPAGARRRIVAAAAALALFVAGLAAGTLGGPGIRAALGLGAAAAPAEAAQPGQLWTCGMHPQVIQDRPGTCPICGMALTPLASGPTAGAAGGEREVAYWWDPMMSPPYFSDTPGKSPMGMDLVPVHTDEVAAGAPLVIDPVVVQNMGLRVAEARLATLTRTIRAFGALVEPEPTSRDVALRVNGWIERLHADTEGMRIAAGDPLFELYSPELTVAIQELIGARALRTGTAGEHGDALQEAAVRKLELLGLPRPRIEELAALDEAPRTVTFTSETDGYLVEKSVYPGSAVMEGQTVMRVADTTRMWLDARVFEKDLPFVRVGQPASATIDALPGTTFSGRVILVHPRIDPATRAALVRMELENPELALRQGMFATARIPVEVAERALVVPREAIIDTGVRQLTFVAQALGHFEPRAVVMGPTGDDGLVQVLAGIGPGEEVVVSGQFLLDAESRTREAVQRFLREKALPGGAAPPVPPAAPAANVLGDASPAWRRAAEDALAAYLEVAGILGLPETSPEPVALDELARAAQALAAAAGGEEQRTLAAGLVATVEAMAGRPLDEQRKRFGAVSAAALHVAERSPRPGDRVPRLFLARCPMVNAPWLQTDETIANPYYATTMKSCGEIVRPVPIPAPASDPGSAGGPR